MDKTWKTLKEVVDEIREQLELQNKLNNHIKDQLCVDTEKNTPGEGKSSAKKDS